MALIDRAKNMLLSPKTEWAAVASEEADPMKVFMGYAVPWILIDAICAFVGHAFIWGAGHYGTSAMSWGMYFAVTAIVTQLISMWIAAMVVNALAPNFGSQKDMGRAMQTIVYGSTASFVGGVLAIVPFIGWLGSLFGLYGIYLIYLGLPHTMKTPQDKVVLYMIVSVVALIVLWMIIGALLASVLMGVFGLSVLSGTRMMGM
jgi:hypothetical protein